MTIFRKKITTTKERLERKKTKKGSKCFTILTPVHYKSGGKQQQQRIWLL